jgi:hypothetical protein
MIPPPGEYRYTIRRGAETVAIEETALASGRLSGLRRSADGLTRYEVEAALDDAGVVGRIALKYRRGPFARDAAYEANEDFLRGSVSALAGRNVVTVKLGRFREVDADLVMFRALIVAHVRARGQARWTGRVAVIDSSTLVAASAKQSCRQPERGANLWRYEPRMSDWEEIELDDAGRIVRRRDSRNLEVTLDSFTPA